MKNNFVKATRLAGLAMMALATVGPMWAMGVVKLDGGSLGIGQQKLSAYPEHSVVVYAAPNVPVGSYAVTLTQYDNYNQSYGYPGVSFDVGLGTVTVTSPTSPFAPSFSNSLWYQGYWYAKVNYVFSISGGTLQARGGASDTMLYRQAATLQEWNSFFTAGQVNEPLVIEIYSPQKPADTKKTGGGNGQRGGDGPGELTETGGDGPGGGGGPEKKKPECGMIGYSFHALTASLRLVDTPLPYSPAFGPSVNFTASYSQHQQCEGADRIPRIHPRLSHRRDSRAAGRLQ